MKKLLVLMAAILIANIVNAQWSEPRFYPADELKGTAEYYSNIYKGVGGYFVSWSHEKDIKIGTYRGIFDYRVNYDELWDCSENYVSVTVGFYVGDVLEEKVTERFYVPDGDPDIAFSPSSLGSKIITHLKTKGKVRFIASKYSGSDFDLTVPMNKKLK